MESPNGEYTVLLLDTGGKSALISVNLLSFFVSESDASESEKKEDITFEPNVANINS